MGLNLKNRLTSSEGPALFGVVATSALLMYAVYLQLSSPETANTYDRTVFHIMLIYLIFVSLRSGSLVAFSFAERFFQRVPTTPVQTPLVSVIIPCFNEEKVIDKAIRSTLEIQYPNFEVIVVDDGSTDLTLLAARELESNTRVRVIYQRNAGKAAALNRGIAEAYGEYVLCVDADSLLDPHVITRALPYYEREPSLGAVAGNVMIGNSTNTLTLLQKLEYIVGLNLHKSAQSFLSAVTIVPGPVGLFRKEALLRVGGYRSDTFAEDCDLTIRLLMAGHRTVYCPLMIAVTEAPEDFESLLKQRYRWSRGTIQAIKANSHWFRHPVRHTRNFAILLYMLVETIVIPSANFLFAMFFIAHAASSAGSVVLGPYFTQLTALDVILTAYSSLFERRLASLILLSLVNRITYGLALEVLRFFSMIDELVGLPMSWNKLERKGL